jgi:endonuclease/exonuclease/phosphatase family metal-dependent hydrolase
MSEIKVAFWNLQNLFDTTASAIATDLEFTPEEGWTEEVYKIKVANLASIVRQMHGGAGPDLLGLCEVENKEVVDDLLAKIGRDDYRVAHVDSPDIRGIDCSLIYSSKVFKAPPAKEMKGHLINFRFPTRDIFQVRLTLKATGAELNVFVNHWPSRRQGQYQSEPLRIAVAERCGQLVNEVLKLDRKEYAELPDTAETLAGLNARWNRNIVLMGDFNDDPFCRSITDYLLASKDFDKLEEVLKASPNREIPAINAYIERQPTLFNLSWPLYAQPDKGTIFFSGDSANTMNLFDQFIVSRGLFYGESGLKARPGSMQIFTTPEMAPGNKQRPKAFDKQTRKGFSDHFPVEMIIDVL